MGYSSRGSAACLDRRRVKEAAERVLRMCDLNNRVEGGAELRVGDRAFEGVLIENS